MKDLTKQLQQRLKLIEQRLSALEEERNLLINEHDHVVALIEQYDTTSAYYDTIEEERNITKVFVPGTEQPKPQRKPDTKVNIEQVRILAEGLGTIIIDDVEEYFDNPPSRGTISKWLGKLHAMGYLKKLESYPVKYKYIPDREALGEEEVNE